MKLPGVRNAAAAEQKPKKWQLGIQSRGFEHGIGKFRSTVTSLLDPSVTVTEDEKVAGLGHGGMGSTTPPTLATYLPSPTFPSLLTTPCPRSLFSSLREFTLAPWTRHTYAIFHPPPPCPRSPFSSLREFTLAPWTRHTSRSLTISKNLRTIFNSFKKRLTRGL